MSKTVVTSWNDFDPLKRVILGRADNCCIPAWEPALEAKIDRDSDMWELWGPRALGTVEKANEELDYFAHVLETHGIIVDRPTPVQWNQSANTPDFSTKTLFGCMPPRDVLLTVGSEIFECGNDDEVPILGISCLSSFAVEIF